MEGSLRQRAARGLVHTSTLLARGGWQLLGSAFAPYPRRPEAVGEVGLRCQAVSPGSQAQPSLLPGPGLTSAVSSSTSFDSSPASRARAACCSASRCWKLRGHHDRSPPWPRPSPGGCGLRVEARDGVPGTSAEGQVAVHTLCNTLAHARPGPVC